MSFHSRKLALLLAIAGLCAVAPVLAQTAADSSVKDIPVYVGDLELPAVVRPGGSQPVANRPSAPTNGAQQTAPPQDQPIIYDPSDAPEAQARRLTNYFADTLIRTLRKDGFNVKRLTSGNPPSGVLLRGVFAEPDAENRISRTLWGGTSPNDKFFLYIGTFNLARPAQPLYQQAGAATGDGKFGPVITMNAYIPMAKYELLKRPTEEDVARICGEIAQNLNALLKANPSAFSQ